MHRQPSILFVCLGNICRSPLAEAAFRKAAEEAGLDVDTDSAGTAAYHVGEPPDPRAIATAAAHGVEIGHYRGRKIAASDYTRFTHILALDGSNLDDIRRNTPSNNAAETGLLMDFVPGREGQAVADPYYGDAAGFEITWREVCDAAEALVEALQKPA